MDSIAFRIRQEVEALSDPDEARALARFFKTGPGEYGEGDRFLGVRAPKLERIARRNGTVDLDTVAALLGDPFHEVRMVGVRILRDRYRGAASDHDRTGLCRFYLEDRHRIDSWDLIDISAPWILGGEISRGRRLGTVRRMAKSADLWTRRKAVVATLGPLRSGDVEPALEISTLVVEDHEDLIQKALGWVLREVGKGDRDALDGFLARHGTAMGRTAVRYAIERHPESARRRLLADTRARRP